MDKNFEEDKKLTAQELDRKYGEPEICLRCGYMIAVDRDGIRWCPGCVAERKSVVKKRFIW